MLDKVFLTILQMDLSASIVILFLLVFRVVVRKLPRGFYYFLWVIAFLQFIVPFGLLGKRTGFAEKAASLSGHETGGAAEERLADKENRDMLPDASAKEAVKSEGMQLAPALTVRIDTTMLKIMEVVYLLGVLILAVIKGKNYITLRRMLADTVVGESGICRQALVAEPFSVGFLHPRIYLPVSLDSAQFESVLSHETAHVKRGDLLVKGIAIACTVVHWFNPLVWIAYRYMVQEMEMSCDEKAIDDLGTEKKLQYIVSLVSLSSEKKGGGSDMIIGYKSGKTAERIKNAIHYQKASIGKRMLAMVLGLGIMIGTIGIGLCTPNCVKGYAAGESAADAGLPEGWSVDFGEVTSAEAVEAQNLQDGLQLVGEWVKVTPPTRRDGTDYETKTHTYVFTLTQSGTVKLRATCTYTVYYYTDGKVHLFQRGISLSTTPDFQGSYFTYGSIANTDGSNSGTLGDKITAIQGSSQWRYELVFVVDSTDGPRFFYNQMTD